MPIKRANYDYTITETLEFGKCFALNTMHSIKLIARFTVHINHNTNLL